MSRPENAITRFSLAERVVHWMVALSFVYCAISGLALWSPRLYWLAAVLGGGETVRVWHPWAGLVYGAVLGCLFLGWARQMRLDADDRAWLRQAHRYARNEEAGLPEAGRFNAGQKMLFWLQSVCLVLFVASGVVLWFPEAMGRSLRLAAILIHPVTAVLSITAIIVHFYMGTAAVPGALRGMVRGTVPEGWARSHHPKWHREVSKR